MSEDGLNEIFSAYMELSLRADDLFEKVAGQFPAEVACSRGCSDCCHAMFDLSLVEAMALNRALSKKYSFGAERSFILEAASEADRKAVRLKRGYYQQAKQGATDAELMALASRDKIRCPLLGTDDSCLLYDHRPITCRLYGIPTAIHGEAHVCPKSGFQKGGAYPTVALDRIQDQLADLSRRLVKELGSRLKELHTVYVPVSMVLLTKYDDAYLGTGDKSGGDAS